MTLPLLAMLLLGAAAGESAAPPPPPPPPASAALEPPRTPNAPPKPPPTDAQCPGFPLPRQPLHQKPGERLEFDLDALGAKAGTLSIVLRSAAQGMWSLDVEVGSNTFFSKIRKVHGTASSLFSPLTLRPTHFTEDTQENEFHRTADLTFLPADHQARLHASVNGTSQDRTFRTAHEAFDYAGAFAALRELPFQKGMPLCADVYGIRRLWRVSGSVVGREHVSLPVGEFEAWHIQGEAVRLDDYTQRRETHLWVSDDAHRLPLVALGTIDLGVVRATLTSISRPHEKPKRDDKSQMRW
jgi:hypothetical protein